MSSTLSWQGVETVFVETVFVNPAAMEDLLEGLLVRATACGVRGVVLPSIAAALEEANPIGGQQSSLP